MTLLKLLQSSVALFSLLALVGCGPDKAKACEGCTDTELRDCETAFEECDNVKHCRHSDIRREWSERICVDGE